MRLGFRLAASIIALCALSSFARAVTASDFVGRWQWSEFNANGQPVPIKADVTSSGGVLTVSYTDPFLTPTEISATVVGAGLQFHAIHFGIECTITIYLSGRVEVMSPSGLYPAVFTATLNGQPVQYSGPVVGYTTVSAADFVGRWQWTRISSTGQSIAIHVDVTQTFGNPLQVTYYSDSGIPTFSLDPYLLNDGLIFAVGEDGQNHTLVIHHATNTVEDWPGGTPGQGTPTTYSATWGTIPTPPPVSGSGGTLPGSGTQTGFLFSNVLVSAPSYSILQNFPGQITVISLNGTMGTTNSNIADIGQDVTFVGAVDWADKASLAWQWSKDGVVIPGATNSTFILTSAQLASAGQYSCSVTNSQGAGSWATQLEVHYPPTIVSQTGTATVSVGQPIHLSVRATAASAPLRFRWYHNGQEIAGTTSGNVKQADGAVDSTSTYDIASATIADAGEYSCAATCYGGTTTTTLRVVANPAHLINLSTRVLAGGAAGTPTCGFVTRGTQSLPVLIRGVGPTLGVFGLGGTMPEPTIKLHSPDASVTTFSGWPADHRSDMTTLGAFGLAAGSKDAATFLTLPGGKYTAEMSDAHGGSGIVMLETYDASADTPVDAALINASTLGYVGTGAQGMFTGFVVKGAGTVKVLVRAVGPSLSAFSVPNPIADPKIQIYQGNTVLAENDNWGTRTDGISVATIQAAASSVGAFTINPASKDAVILRDFPEGTYSAQINGANGETGTAIVELYVVP